MIWKPHVTVAAVAEHPKKTGYFLFVEENIDRQWVINQPAGHLDANETLLQAVVRETLEETAWDFVPEAIVGIYQWHNPQYNNHTMIRIAYCGRAIQEHFTRKLDDGIRQAFWLNREELMQSRLRSPMVLATLDDYLAGKRYPLELVHDLLN